MRPEGLPAHLRIKKRRDFLRAQGKGDKHHVRHFMVFVVPRRLVADPTRLGITVTRKVGKAHQRNRIKRLVREVFRKGKSALPSGLDVVFVAKRNATELTYDAASRDFGHLVSRLTSSRYAVGVGTRSQREPRAE